MGGFENRSIVYSIGGVKSWMNRSSKMDSVAPHNSICGRAWWFKRFNRGFNRLP